MKTWACLVSVVLLVMLTPLSGSSLGKGAKHSTRPGLMPRRTVSRPVPPVVIPRSVVQPHLQRANARDPQRMRVLVISADGTEPSFRALMTILDQIGIPADAFIAVSQGPLTAERLFSGPDAHYYAVMLATGNLGYCDNVGCRSAFTPGEWQILADFESQFLIRRVSLFTFPTAEYGFNPYVAAGEIPATGVITAAGRQVFSYLNPNVQIPIRNAWTYFATTAPGVTPLIVTPDGFTLAALTSSPDGRETLAFSMDNNPDLLHTRLIAYGAINWATKGLYVGQRRVYLHPQVDDLFIDDDRYFGGEFRMSSLDFQATIVWQDGVRRRPQTGDFRLAFAFNGEGTISPGDPLTEIAVANHLRFSWINHTYTHLNLDTATTSETRLEISRNTQVARTFGFSAYSRSNLVTPDISGLNNPAAMIGAAKELTRYVVSDWSIPSQRNPSFNTGIPNVHAPAILQVPRYPTNVFYNVTEPAELLAEFAVIHPTFCSLFPSYCPLTYERFLDFESGILLGYLLTYDLNPVTFHQSNLREYQTGRSLLADLINTVLTKYEVLAALRIRTLTMNGIGTEMQRRAAYNAAGVVGILVPGQSMTITATSGSARIPITGVRFGAAESYGSQWTSYVTLSRGQSVTIPLL